MQHFFLHLRRIKRSFDRFAVRIEDGIGAELAGLLRSGTSIQPNKRESRRNEVYSPEFDFDRNDVQSSPEKEIE